MIWKNPPPFNPKNAKPAKIITPEDLAKSGSEDGEQAALFCWSAMNVDKYPELKWLHSIPNGGSRHIAEASKMVATGLRVGVWDIFLPCPTYRGMSPEIGYCGCYIEMKRADRRNQKNGGLTDEQLEFRDYAIMIGYYCEVCYSWIEARDTLINYLEGKL